VDSQAASLEGAATSADGAASADAAAVADDCRRVEELLRVNERLAAEVRSLAVGRTEEPRSSAMTAARRLGALIDERETLLAELEQALATAIVRDQAYAALERDRDRLAAEVRRLRGGWRGLLRRARARLSLRR
jgi:HPt (histidine-containing phosphotransfer) domain-containing protein